MFRKLLLGFVLATAFSSASLAQTCPTRPTSDNSNACADTAFVKNNLAGGGTISPSAIALPTNQIIIGNGGVGVAAPMTGACTIAYVAGNAVTTCSSTGASGINAGISNCNIAVSVASNNVTFAVKTDTGVDPSSGTPCTVIFRNANLTDGTPVTRTITAANSVVLNSGSSLGASNSVAFKAWAVLVDTGTSATIGVSLQTTSSAQFPLPEYGVRTTVACSACAGATSANVIYTTSALTSKPYRILGWAEWSGGLATAGTWASSATTIQAFSAGSKTPGDPIQTQTGSRTTQDAFTLATYTITNVTTSITPTLASNVISCAAAGPLVVQTLNDTASLIIQRGGVNVGIGSQISNAVGSFLGSGIYISGTDAPSSTGALTYAAYIKGNTAGHNYFFPASGSSEIGASISCTEIMS